MEDNQKNNIRPTKIRIVNPTPKTSQPTALLQKPNGDWKDKLNLLVFVVLGSILFFILNMLGVWKRIAPGEFGWKQLTLIQIMYLLLIFIIPSFIYLLIKPRIAEKFNLKLNPLTAALSTLIGIPFAYLLAVITAILSLILKNSGLISNVHSFGEEVRLFPMEIPIYHLIFIVVICVLPSIIVEISLRGILFKELLYLRRQSTAIFISALISGVLAFQSQDFIPYFGLGWLCSLIFIYHQSAFITMLCHFSFKLTYSYLIVRINNLNLNVFNDKSQDLESLLPTIGKALIALTLFVPLFVVLSQTKRINPILNSDEIISRHSKKKDPANRLHNIALVSLIIVFILFLIVNKNS